MTHAYDFNERRRAGAQGEVALDAFFAEWYYITPATLAQQRHGVDRIFTDRASGAQIAVEYKTDWTASRTGNAFVETISVDRDSTPGWVYTSSAAYLMYYLPDDDLVYILTLAALRAQLPRWQRTYPTRAIPNYGYFTHGVLVPLHEFERLAVEVHVIPGV
jgi:hypothetical protein